VRAAAALDAITTAGGLIYVPAICLVEAIYLAEKGRIPGVADIILPHMQTDH
jgi:hypothetical protein